MSKILLQIFIQVQTLSLLLRICYVLINGERIFRNSCVHKTMFCFRLHLTFSITGKINKDGVTRHIRHKLLQSQSRTWKNTSFSYFVFTSRNFMHLHPEYLETSEDSKSVLFHQEVLTNKNIAVNITATATNLPTVLLTLILKVTTHVKYKVKIIRNPPRIYLFSLVVFCSCFG